MHYCGFKVYSFQLQNLERILHCYFFHYLQEVGVGECVHVILSLDVGCLYYYRVFNI